MRLLTQNKSFLVLAGGWRVALLLLLLLRPAPLLLLRPALLLLVTHKS